MSAPDPARVPQISIVVPVVERHGDLGQLHRRFEAELDRLGKRAEIIYVVDERQRAALPSLRELQQRATHETVLLVLGGKFGESAALTLGLEHATAETIVTSASYLQVEAGGLEVALAELEHGADLVVGRRFPRSDSWINRLQSAVFHKIVAFMTGSRFGDISCGFRVMNRLVARDLKIYGGLHRFIPLLALHQGFVVRELKLAQDPEDYPARYHGWAVYLKRLLDVLTVFFLMKFTHRPLRFFGAIGAPLAAVGLGITAYLGVYRILQLGAIAGRPILLFGVLLAVLGVHILSIGLVGEIIVFTHSRQIRHYRIAEIIHRSPEAAEELPDRVLVAPTTE